jgi:hypothetical protein
MDLARPHKKYSVRLNHVNFRINGVGACAVSNPNYVKEVMPVRIRESVHAIFESCKIKIYRFYRFAEIANIENGDFITVTRKHILFLLGPNLIFFKNHTNVPHCQGGRGM